MARRQQLNETQVAALFEPPTTQGELVLHYTLSNSDLVAIRRCRDDQNRLGYALMLCYLRFPGRALCTGERPPAPLLAFVSAQIDVLTSGIDEYLATDRSRQRHAILCQEQLGLRRFGRRTAAELTDVLLARAIEKDSLAFLAELVMQTCRERAIVVPSAAALERLCADLRHGERDITASLTDQAIDLFDRLVGAMFRKAEGRHARAFQADARAINEKVRLYAHVGAALIAARQSKQDAYGAITTVIPWERFCATVAQAEALARPDEFDTLEKLGEHYAGIRRCAACSASSSRCAFRPSSIAGSTVSRSRPTIPHWRR